MEKELFESVMKGKWHKVIQKYGEDERAHNAVITWSGETALHIAVSDNKEEVVDQLVSIIRSKKSEDVLEIKNERGNTPLHLAASMGNVKLCRSIVGKESNDSPLVNIRNVDGETPLFLAALHGNKEVFRFLDSLLGNDPKSINSRRNDGETTLHCAIKGDYFDLAYQIIHLCPDLANSNNELGQTPLHFLATKPSAFRSGSHLNRWRKIVYHCIFVDKLNKDSVNDGNKSTENSWKEPNSPSYPKNYQTCANFFHLLEDGLQVVTTRRLREKEPRNQEATKTSREEEPRIKGRAQDQQILPSNYTTCFNFVKFVSKAMLVILGLGSTEIRKIQVKKEKHTWSFQLMNELLEKAKLYEYDSNGRNPRLTAPPKEEEDSTKPYDIVDGGAVTFAPDSTPSSSTTQQPGQSPDNNTEENDEQIHMTAGKRMPETTILIAAKNGVTEMFEKIPKLFPMAIHDMNDEKKNSQPYVYKLLLERNDEHKQKRIPETPLLIAAKNGVTEMVEKILELFHVAIHDMNEEKKNVVLLAVENRQPHVYKLLLERKILSDNVFRKVDREGNSSLHLAAKLGQHKPWLISGEALQMQWELKWYEYVKNSMPPHFFVRSNNEGKTAKEIFTDTHRTLLENGGRWLASTSESCSVVAALIATVAFATSSTVPGGNDEIKGTPLLKNEPAFDVFAISSLVALCFSVTSVIMFLSILTSRYQDKDFGTSLPRKLLVGLTSLFVSIAAILVSFCAGHFLLLKDKLKYAAYPVYAVTCLPVTFFAVAQFPLYFDLIWATFKKVPQRSYKVAPL